MQIIIKGCSENADCSHCRQSDRVIESFISHKDTSHTPTFCIHRIQTLIKRDHLLIYCIASV